MRSPAARRHLELSAHPSHKTRLGLTVARAILERTGHEQTIGDVVADGLSRWSADSADGSEPTPEHSGALYDGSPASSTYRLGAPHGGPAHTGPSSHTGSSVHGPTPPSGYPTSNGQSPYASGGPSYPLSG